MSPNVSRCVIPSSTSICAAGDEEPTIIGSTPGGSTAGCAGTPARKTASRQPFRDGLFIQYPCAPSAAAEEHPATAAASRTWRKEASIREKRLHPVRKLDAQQAQPVLQRACGQLAQGQAGVPHRPLRLQDRARLIEGMESPGQVKQVGGQHVRTAVVQHLRHHFPVAGQKPGQMDFRIF